MISGLSGERGRGTVLGDRQPLLTWVGTSGGGACKSEGKRIGFKLYKNSSLSLLKEYNKVINISVLHL